MSNATVPAAPQGLNEWAITCNEAMDMNGFNDTTGRTLTPDDPVAQIAALGDVKLRFTDVVEAVRKPDEYSITASVLRLLWEVILLGVLGLKGYTARYLRQTDQEGFEVHGSMAQVEHRLVLADTETSEGILAARKWDVQNLAEEIADTIYRLLNLVGHWNTVWTNLPIDMDGTMEWKHRKNLERGWRHGKKRA